MKNDFELWICFGIGLFELVFVPFLVYARSRLFDEIGIFSSKLNAETGGIVVEVLEKTGKGGALFSALVEFEVAGEKWKVEDSIACRPAIYNLGDKVNVRFCQEDPSQAKIQSEKLSRLYFWLNVLSLVFISFFVITGLFVSILSFAAIANFV